MGAGGMQACCLVVYAPASVDGASSSWFMIACAAPEHWHPSHCPAGCRVHLASGRVLAARAVIYTAANLQPVLPAWARQLQVAPPPQQEQGKAEHKQQACELPAGIATSDSVDLRGAELAGKQVVVVVVVVVGGGMSAGLLAAGAAERGAEVTLVCRR